MKPASMAATSSDDGKAPIRSTTATREIKNKKMKQQHQKQFYGSRMSFSMPSSSKMADYIITGHEMAMEGVRKMHRIHTTCIVPRCNAKIEIMKQGKCRYHYNLDSRIEGPRCILYECNRNVYSLMLCKSHYRKVERPYKEQVKKMAKDINAMKRNIKKQRHRSINGEDEDDKEWCNDDDDDDDILRNDLRDRNSKSSQFHLMESKLDCMRSFIEDKIKNVNSAKGIQSHCPLKMMPTITPESFIPKDIHENTSIHDDEDDYDEGCSLDKTLYERNSHGCYSMGDESEDFNTSYNYEIIEHKSAQREDIPFCLSTKDIKTTTTTMSTTSTSTTSMNTRQKQNGNNKKREFVFHDDFCTSYKQDERSKPTRQPKEKRLRKTKLPPHDVMWNVSSSLPRPSSDNACPQDVREINTKIT